MVLGHGIRGKGWCDEKIPSLICQAVCTKVIQLNLAITDLKGPTTFICYRRISTIANIGIKEKPFQGTTKLLIFSSVIGCIVH